MAGHLPEKRRPPLNSKAPGSNEVLAAIEAVQAIAKVRFSAPFVDEV